MNEEIKNKLEEMNICVNTQTGEVFVGGTKRKNKLHKDDSGYYLITGFGKFLKNKYPIKKYFKNKIEIAALNQYINN